MNINSLQELVHWAGTVCVGRGELEITFEELLDAMHDPRFRHFVMGFSWGHVFFFFIIFFVLTDNIDRHEVDV